MEIAEDEAPTSGSASMSSVEKALRLLDVFSPQRTHLGVSEIARRAHVAKSTTFRLLTVLADNGILQRTGTEYSLGPRIADLADLVPGRGRRDLRDVALPFLQDLYERSRETISLAVLDGVEALYIENIFGHTATKSASYVGGKLPASCTAIGKAMIAFSDVATVKRFLETRQALTPYSIVTPRVLAGELQKIRESGVAFDIEEAKLGLASVAAPILDPDGGLIGAVSISGPSQRIKLDSYVSSVRDAASGIAARYSQESKLHAV